MVNTRKRGRPSEERQVRDPPNIDDPPNDDNQPNNDVPPNNDLVRDEVSVIDDVDDVSEDEASESDSSSESSNTSKSFTRFAVPNMEPYKKGDDIEYYLMRLEAWMELGRIREKDKTSLAITVIGSFAFNQLAAVSRNSILKVPFANFKTLLRDRFAPKQTWLYERVQFF